MRKLNLLSEKEISVYYEIFEEFIQFCKCTRFVYRDLVLASMPHLSVFLITKSVLVSHWSLHISSDMICFYNFTYTTFIQEFVIKKYRQYMMIWLYRFYNFHNWNLWKNTAKFSTYFLVLNKCIQFLKNWSGFVEF